jgi:hypothetical protein
MALASPSSDMGISSEYVTTLERRIVQLEEQIGNFEKQILSQQTSISNVTKRLPDTDLLSSSFIKRAFTVWGHMFVAQLLIAVPIYCLIFLLASIGSW